MPDGLAFPHHLCGLLLFDSQAVGVEGRPLLGSGLTAVEMSFGDLAVISVPPCRGLC